MVTEAIELWLRRGEVSDEDARYVTAYLREPEKPEEIDRFAALAAESWEPWE